MLYCPQRNIKEKTMLTREELIEQNQKLMEIIAELQKSNEELKESVAYLTKQNRKRTVKARKLRSKRSKK